jgi:hypothetical protein
VLNGANAAAAALRRRLGGVHNAELVGTRTYQLSLSARPDGQRMGDGRSAAGRAPFVLLDPQIVTIACGVETLGHPMQLRHRGRPQLWRSAAVAHGTRSRPRLPLAPCDLPPRATVPA